MRTYLFFVSLFCLLLSWQSIAAADSADYPRLQPATMVESHAVMQAAVITSAQSGIHTAHAGLANLIDDALSEEAGFNLIQVDLAELSEMDIDKIIFPASYPLHPAVSQARPAFYHAAYLRLLAFWLDKPPQPV